MTKYTQIPRNALVTDHWYVGKGRNGNIGLWNGEDFFVPAKIGKKVGPREWISEWSMKKEPYFEADSGCFQPFKIVDMGIVCVPTGERDYALTMSFND